MDQKKLAEAITKLAEAVQKQQKMIEKIAQALPPNPPPPPAQSLPAPTHPNLREADTILNALPPAVKATVARLEVKLGEVLVRFVPGKATQQAFQGIQTTVQQLQASNQLPGQNYIVKQV